MSHAVGPRLSAMMLLHYFSMGAWIVTLTTYLLAPPGVGLHFTPGQVGWIYSTLAIGGLISPVLVGILADRLFAAERVMALLSLASALLLAAAAGWCQTNAGPIADAFRAAGEREVAGDRPFLAAWDEFVSAEVADPRSERVRELRDQIKGPLERAAADPVLRAAVDDAFGPLFGIMLVYSICLLMNSTLANVVAMRNLADPAQKFGGVRLWGTVGWMLAGYSVGPLMQPPSHLPLYLAAAGALALGVYSFTLPHTPPKGRSSPILEVVGLPAFTLFRQFPFTVFVGCMFLVTVMQQWYGVYTPPFLYDVGIRPAASWMTIAQASEVCCLLLIPGLYARLGLKGLMVLGLVGFTLRNTAFASGEWYTVVLLGLPLQGVGYTFFTIMGSLYIDRLAPPHLRAGAQGLITLVSLGPGIMLGNMAASRTVEFYKSAAVIDWSSVWVVPALGSLAALGVFAVLFRSPVEQGPKQDYPEPEEFPTGTSGVQP